MPEQLSANLQEDIQQMMQEAMDKGYSVREIDSKTWLLAAKNSDPTIKREINFYKVFPEKFNIYSGLLNQ